MKNIIRNAAKIGLVSLLGLGAVGCAGDHRQYHFKGKIDGELFHFFEEGIFEDKNNLLVQRKNGAYVLYSDYCNNDLIVDVVEVRDDSTHAWYRDRGHLRVAQADFDRYLQRILEIKDSTEKADEGGK
jgi:isopentenyldiphosphate isomerase